MPDNRIEEVNSTVVYLNDQQLDEIVREHVKTPVNEADHEHKMMVLRLVSDLRNCRADNEQQQAEIERIAAERDQYAAEADGYEAEYKKSREENERLRGELEQVKAERDELLAEIMKVPEKGESQNEQHNNG